MKFFYTTIFFLVLLPISKGNNSNINVSDSRLSQKSIKWNISLNNGKETIQNKLVHHSWLGLKYSDQVNGKNKQIYSVITGGMLTQFKDIKKCLPDNIHEKYFSILNQKMSFNGTGDFGKKIIINSINSKIHIKTSFYMYFQEILKLEITKVNSKDKSKKTFSFLLGTNSTSSLIITWIRKKERSYSGGRHRR